MYKKSHPPTIKVRDKQFSHISGYMNRFFNDNESGVDFHLSHTPQLILHYFPDLSITEDVVVTWYDSENGIEIYTETLHPKAKGYIYDKTPYRIKDFYLIR